MSDCEVISETESEIERVVTYKDNDLKSGKLKEKIVLGRPMKVWSNQSTLVRHEEN